MHPKSSEEIFDALPQKSVGFIFDEIKGTSKEAKRKLLKAKDESKVETKSFDDASLDLLTFDWVSVDMDRNWWWQVQALPFLEWFAQSYKLFESTERLDMLSYCLEATEQWIRQEDKAAQSPLRWHDHATVYRLTNLVHCLVVASKDSQLIQVIFDVEKSVPLAELITQHVQWLMQDENYSKHTNHGFDQAMAVLSLGLLVEKKFWAEDAELAESRLIDEVRFAFSEEGVHKENSPGYHVFMMRRLEKLVRLEQLGETTVGIEARKIQEGAERFLEAITLPDGTLPMVGDTRGGQKGKLTDIPDGPPIIYDFSTSGYVVIKGKYEKKPYYFLIKNCHDSNYHRHDDDLSVYLWFDKYELLTDPGLGSHNEGCKKRVSLRSAESHTTVFYADQRADRDTKRLLSKPTIRIDGDKVHASSYSYGTELSRIVDISNIGMGRVTITDNGGGRDEVLVHNFMTRLDADVRDKGVVLSIPNSSDVIVAEISSEGSEWSLHDAPYSSAYGVYESCKALRFLSSGKDVRITVNFGLASCIESGKVCRNSEKLYCLKYRDFPAYDVFSQVNWSDDPYKSNNWVHNFLSLRWIADAPYDVQEKVIREFVFAYRSDSSVKSFLEQKRFDHTVSIRLKVLVGFRNCCSSAFLEELEEVIGSHLDLMLSDGFYRYGFNHGLLVDESLLWSELNGKVLSASALGVLLGRIERQLDELYDDSGVTREHSVSYQEYNLNVLYDILAHLNHMGSKGCDDLQSIQKKIENIFVVSKKFLVAAHIEENRILNIGDSFRKSNAVIVKKVYGVNDLSELSYINDCDIGYPLVYPKAGFYFHKMYDQSCGDVFYSVVSGHNSRCHKSNDELSVCLLVNNKFVVFDGGYTDRYDRLQKALKMRSSHSTFGLLKESDIFESKSVLSPNDEWVRGVELAPDLKGVVAKSVFKEVTLYRFSVWAADVGLIVLDWASNKLPLVHQFIVERAEVLGDRIFLSEGVELVAGGGQHPDVVDVEVSGESRSDVDLLKKLKFENISGSSSLFVFSVNSGAECRARELVKNRDGGISIFLHGALHEVELASLEF